MSDLPQRIVRPLGEDERIPAYSTVELMLGVRHIVKGLGESRVDQIHAGRAKSLKIRQKRAAERFLKNFQTIKEMLLNGSENQEIAIALDVSLATIGNYIAKSTELQSISQTRCRRRQPRMGSTMTDSRSRFMQQEHAIEGR